MTATGATTVVMYLIFMIAEVFAGSFLNFKARVFSKDTSIFCSNLYFAKSTTNQQLFPAMLFVGLRSDRLLIVNSKMF